MDSFITVVGYTLGLLIILCSAFVCSAPVKYIFTFVLNSVVGCVILSLFNVFFGSMGWSVGINPITAVCTGVLGVPGALAVIVLALILR